MEYHMAKLLRRLQPILPLLFPFVFFVQQRVVLVSHSSTPLFTWMAAKNLGRSQVADVVYGDRVVQKSR
ncbi:unnamed protein product [Victoria cruziana]